MKPKTFLRNNPWPTSKMLRKLLSNKFYTLSTNLQVFFFNGNYRYGRTGIYKTYIFGKPSVIVCTQETGRKVLTNDDKLKLGYQKATTILTGKSFLGI